ncbi:MAG TPA: hypothetical protein IAD42_07285 [Candidatus Scatomorpha pullistercoris]|uniref:Uncharacterized protein n=1 Tax=Candidatus Scatomorpha pullistercoris TaxID=2840929 RepID=A0A9D1G6T6_9FIRM|nr:hypothetical protein [Candidatus Scatomorpha pullistercoris]
MDDFGDKLNAILSDPAALSRISELAKSVMGGESRPGDTQADEPDPGLMAKLAGLLGRNSVKREERALLEAMKPFLSEKRRNKMDKAMKLARLAGLAGIAAAEFGLGDKEDADV